MNQRGHLTGSRTQIRGESNNNVESEKGEITQDRGMAFEEA